MIQLKTKLIYKAGLSFKNRISCILDIYYIFDKLLIVLFWWCSGKNFSPKYLNIFLTFAVWVVACQCHVPARIFCSTWGRFRQQFSFRNWAEYPNFICSLFYFRAWLHSAQWTFCREATEQHSGCLRLDTHTDEWVIVQTEEETGILSFVKYPNWSLCL